MRKISFVVGFLAGWILLSSFHQTDAVQPPWKKMNKTIAKLWINKTLMLKKAPTNSGMEIGGNLLFEVAEQTKTLGYIYVGRVNSCRSGGCSVEFGGDAFESEYFDYFFVADTAGAVMKVQVFNYRATHGHEIMSRGWLRQFVGYSGQDELIYGKDIQAISGATVSVKAISNDIQAEVGILKKWLTLSKVIVQVKNKPKPNR